MAGCSLDRVSWDEAATEQLLTADSVPALLTQMCEETRR